MTPCQKVTASDLSSRQAPSMAAFPRTAAQENTGPGATRWRLLRRIGRLLSLLLVSGGLLLSLAGEWPDRSGEEFVYSSLIHNRRFDFVGWELDALAGKALYGLAPAHIYLAADDQRAMVFEYLSRLEAVQSLEAEIASLFADPSVTQPEAASAELSRQVSAGRRRLADIQPAAEGIMQEQTATVLVDLDVTTAGRAFPPVQLRFTPLPAMLVVSRRDLIEAIRFVPLERGLDTPQRAEMEEAIDQTLDVSSLVVNIGGLAAYPAMMLESTSLDWALNTAAHEWTHHYLTLRPLGLLYDTSPEMRTMNETAASIVGNEVGPAALRRYYPERVPPPAAAGPAPAPLESPVFDYRAEMRDTRLHVDALLAQDQIDEAEAYMEERRQFFWQNGYQIRKLNQAFFAFYSAYAEEPGEQGEDPVGPAVVALRQESPTLRVFLERIASLTSYAELQQVLTSGQTGRP